MYGFYEAKRLLRYSLIRSGLTTINSLKLHKIWPGAAQNGLIFTLHHVRPQSEQKFSPNALLSVTPEFLESTIQTVLRAGMVPVHVHDLPRLLLNNPQKQRFICFTLDDGYKNNAEFAAPIFRKYGIPFTIYVTANFAEHKHILWWETIEYLLRERTALSFDFGSGEETVPLYSTMQKMSAFAKFAYYVDRTDEDLAIAMIDNLARECDFDALQLTRDLVMSVTELQQLVQACREKNLLHLGAHSLSHINLHHAKTERIQEEVSGSADWIYQNFGTKPQSFAYPYGWKSAVDQRCRDSAQEAGLEIAVTTQPGMIKPACLQQVYNFPRVSLNGYFQKTHYVEALINGIAFR